MKATRNLVHQPPISALNFHDQISDSELPRLSGISPLGYSDNVGTLLSPRRVSKPTNQLYVRLTCC
jgi:hypothetical protein